MIIDAHLHLWDKKWLPEWAWQLLDFLEAPRFGMTAEEFAQVRPESWDPSGDTYVEILDEVGVDRANIAVVDWGQVAGHDDADLPIEEINRLTYEAVKRHPDRLSMSVGVDPRRGNALKVLERGVKEWGARALKLYSNAGWYANDKIAYPLYEKCVEYGIPVNFHTGPLGGPFKSKYSSATVIEEVAADFPELTVYATHSGHGQFMDMIAVAAAHHNILVDFASWWRWILHPRPIRFYKVLRYAMDMLPGRVLFASDWTGHRRVENYARMVRTYTHVPGWVAKEYGIEFTQEEMEDFLGNIAKRLLKL